MLNSLPVELLLEIFSYLSPGALRNMALADKNFSPISSRVIPIDKKINSFWENKFKRHFPEIYKEIEKEITLNWYAEFSYCYDKTYKGLPNSTKKIFSIVKENDFESLKKIENLNLEILDAKDSDGVSLLDLVTKNNYQKILDHFYQVAQGYFAKSKYTLDTSKKDKLNRTILYWAIILRQSSEQLSILLGEGSQLDEIYGETNSCNPIHLAAKLGLTDLVKTMIKKNPGLLNQTDIYNQTPLLWAASEGHFELVEFLISKNAKKYYATFVPQEHIFNGRTALYWATLNGHHKIVNLLAKSGASTTTALGLIKLQPIHIAAKLGYLDVVKALIDNRPLLLEQTDAYGQTPLYWAALSGQTDIVDYLISKGANVNVFSTSPMIEHTGKSPLYQATEKNYCQIVKSLLKAGAIINAPDNLDHPIHIASKKGNLDLVKTLIDYNPKLIEQKDFFGQTPLLWAAAKGQKDVVDYFILKNANLDVISIAEKSKNNGKTPVYWATESGHSEIVDSLAKAGANITTALGELKSQPIHIAAKEGKLEVVIALLENNPKLIDETDAEGENPLHIAASYGHETVVDYLLANKSNVNALNLNGKSALYLATEQLNSNIVKSLLNAGAIPTTYIKPQKDQPVHIAAREGNYNLVKTFIEHDLNLLEQENAFRETPILLASAQGHKEIVDYLISKGANVNAVSYFPKHKDHGKSALYWATEKKYVDVVNSLAKAGAVTTTPISSLVQPIYLAIQYNRLDLVQALIKNDFKLINHVDRNGHTPLHWAASEGREDIVRYLISQDAELNPLAKDNKAPINLAAKNGNNQIVELLLKAGAKTTLPVAIDQSNLNEDIKGKIKLLDYIPKRKQESMYKTSYNFFCFTANFGYSKLEKVSAAEALASVKLFGADQTILDKYKGELNDGELKIISKMIR
ncbi:MAG: ankyrin repeat domain-containing protein [Tatlockia sp.]|nr:ankyrin repeat domain-containing protein [Tatlockia sp.]